MTKRKKPLESPYLIMLCQEFSIFFPFKSIFVLLLFIFTLCTYFFFSCFTLQVLLTYIIASRVCEWVSLSLVPSLRFFSFWFVLSYSDVLAFVLLLLYYILLLSPRNLFFNERQKKGRSGWEWSWGETGRSRVRGKQPGYIVRKKKSIFNKRGKKE